MKKISKNRASKELDKILESVAKPKVEKAQEISKFKKFSSFCDRSRI